MVKTLLSNILNLNCPPDLKPKIETILELPKKCNLVLLFIVDRLIILSLKHQNMINNNPSQPQVTKSGVLLYLTNSKKTKYMQFAFMQSQKKANAWPVSTFEKVTPAVSKKLIFVMEVWPSEAVFVAF